MGAVVVRVSDGMQLGHGTSARYRRHLREGTRPCLACKVAEAERSRLSREKVAANPVCWRCYRRIRWYYVQIGWETVRARFTSPFGLPARFLCADCTDEIAELSAP